MRPLNLREATTFDNAVNLQADRLWTVEPTGIIVEDLAGGEDLNLGDRTYLYNRPDHYATNPYRETENTDKVQRILPWHLSCFRNLR